MGRLPIFTSGIDFVDACLRRTLCQAALVGEKAGHDEPGRKTAAALISFFRSWVS